MTIKNIPINQKYTASPTYYHLAPKLIIALLTFFIPASSFALQPLGFNITL
jgi:hypothetical protein